MTDVAPFVFVCACRYAIDRTVTGASQDVAVQVLAHADSIRQDAGCAGAIVMEVREWISFGDRRHQAGVMPHELAAIEATWLQVVDALTGARSEQEAMTP